MSNLFLGRAAIVLTGLFGLVGCGSPSSPPTTYPVQGKVQYLGGTPNQLAGALVEAVLVNDRRVLAQGEIQADGTFRLETLHRGSALDGVPEGEYRVRVVLRDEERPDKRTRRPVIASRFVNYESSGLTFQAPATNYFNLQVSSR